MFDHHHKGASTPGGWARRFLALALALAAVPALAPGAAPAQAAGPTTITAAPRLQSSGLHVVQEPGGFILTAGADGRPSWCDAQWRSDPPRTGERITAALSIENTSSQPITVARLLVAARGPGAVQSEWSAPGVDFPAVSNLVLQPGQRYDYKQSRTFTAAGDYFAEPVYQDAQGRWLGFGGDYHFPFDVVSAAVPGTQVQGEEIGSVYAMALDAAGNGWAWASPKPQTFATSFLLRIENGTWRVAATSTDNPALLPPEVFIQRMAITADGSDGWAIGHVGNSYPQPPMLWRLQQGAWRLARNSFTPTFQMTDLALSADGHDGWITAQETKNEQDYRLLRLRNGSWDFAPQPTEGVLDYVAMSADGRSGWGIGPSVVTPRGNEGAFRWNGTRWIAIHDEAVPLGEVAVRVAADNAGNGWLITLPVHEGEADGSVVRLRPDKAPRPAPLNLHLPGADADRVLRLRDVVVDGLGRGWVTGSFDLGDNGELPTPKELYQPELLRLDGDNVTVVPIAGQPILQDKDNDPVSLAISPNGGHAWLGGRNGFAQGRLGELREPWTHAKPAQTAPLPGAAICFAEVPYCLRGTFARYWTSHGGLGQFGFPITPEVQETIGGKTYTVQYTQRNRFEYHPEYAGTPSEVLLGLLGNALADPRKNEPPFQPAPQVAGSRWFPQTGHNIAAPFLAFWQANGGLPVFGLPRSEAFIEGNAADGKPYLVQYFERNRLEYHPENKGTPYEMLLGLLGVEQFSKTYGFKP